jgi:hypothetical protein
MALMLDTSGRVMAQFGFTRSVDVMSACALAAAIHATASELGKQMDGKPFSGSHFAGRDRQFFLAPTRNRQGTQLICAVFDSQTSIGLVRVYFEELARALAVAAPDLGESAPQGPTAEEFESDLDRSLSQLFGRS